MTEASRESRPGSGDATPGMPDFSPARWRWRIARDLLLRSLAAVVLLTVFVFFLRTDAGGSALGVLGAVAVIVGWVALNASGAATMRALPKVTAMLELSPGAAELALRPLWDRWCLPRWVRLTLSHRWAMLRHHQQRYGEAAALAQTVLRCSSPGPAAAHRSHLLLLLAESRLEMRDAVGAWMALTELANTALSLGESLQRMALQTRYELMIGHEEAALYRAEEKISLAELMPAGPCGAFHAMLATAAYRLGDTPRYQSLWARVELLCTPEQIQQMRESYLAI